jgi:hypothetical protein
MIVMNQQSKEGLSLSCHPGRGSRALFISLAHIESQGVTNHPRPVLAPGAALGLLLSIALSSGQANLSLNKTVRGRNRQHALNLKIRTFLTS